MLTRKKSYKPRNSNIMKKEAIELANKIWEEHIDVFGHFDLLCVTVDLKAETKSTALFSSLVTLERMLSIANGYDKKRIKTAIIFLKESKYYSRPIDF